MTRKRVGLTDINLSIKDIPHAKVIPKTFKIGRETQTQLANIKNSLFDGLTKEELEGCTLSPDFEDNVTKVDYAAFCMAVAHILSNQSYLYGNEEYNSGTKQEQAKDMTAFLGEKVYVGTIETTLTELCSKGYGEKKPTAKQRKAMRELIDNLDVIPVSLTTTDGRTIRKWVCKKMSEDIRGKFKNGLTGEVVYELALNPIFTYKVKSSYALFEQDTMYRLSEATKKKTEAHYVLINIIAAHKKPLPLVRAIPSLITAFGIKDEVYLNQRKRTETQLISVFDDMVKAGFVQRYELGYHSVKGKQIMNKVTFYFKEEKSKRGEG